MANKTEKLMDTVFGVEGVYTETDAKVDDFLTKLIFCLSVGGILGLPLLLVVGLLLKAAF